MIENIIGFAAGFLIAVSMIPQVIKSYKTKSVEDISPLMLFVIGIGTALWVIYGILITSFPIIAMDGFGFLVNLILIYMKIVYRKYTSPRDPALPSVACHVALSLHFVPFGAHNSKLHILMRILVL